MQIIVDKKEMMDAIAIARGNVQTDNNVSDVYESVMISVNDDGIWIYASDGSIWSRVQVRGLATGKWQTLIKNSQFANIINNLNDGEIVIDFFDKAQFVMLKSGRYTAKFQARNAMEFPLPPRQPSKNLISIPAKQFGDLVGFLEDSASSEADRPYLHGINFGVGGGVITGVAADGYRLASGRLRTAGTEPLASATCPVRLARQGASLAVLRPIDGSIMFGFQDGWGFFVGDRAEVCGTLNPATYPNWREAAAAPKPGEPEKWASYDRKVLAKSLKRVISIHGKSKGYVDVSIRGNGELFLESAASGKHAEDVVEPTKNGGSKQGIHTRRVSGDLLSRSLSEFGKDDITIRIPENPDHPIILDNGDKKDEISFFIWVMPRS